MNRFKRRLDTAKERIRKEVRSHIRKLMRHRRETIERRVRDKKGSVNMYCKICVTEIPKREKKKGRNNIF